MLCSILRQVTVDKPIAHTLLDHDNQEIALERNDTVEDLGVWSDEKLLFREHIQAKNNKAYDARYVIKRNSKHLTIPILS